MRGSSQAAGVITTVLWELAGMSIELKLSRILQNGVPYEPEAPAEALRMPSLIT